MAKLTGRTSLELNVTFEVNEEEAHALDALAGYGDNAFVEAFYEKLGKAYMQKHETGLRSFLKSIRDQLPRILARARDAGKVFTGELIAVCPDEASN